MKSVLLHVCLITGTSALVHDVFAAKGETLLLPQDRRLQYTGGSLCDQIIWTFKAPGRYLRQLAKVGEYCARQECSNHTSPHCSLASNGSLWLYGVKAGDAGQYKVTIYNVRREKSSEDTFTLQVLALDPSTGTHTDMYVLPGSDAVLHLTYNLTGGEDRTQCDQFIWIYSGLAESALIIRSKGCEMTQHNFQRISNYSISPDGRLTLINVTRNISGNYTVGVYNSRGEMIFSHNYALHVQGFPKTTAEGEDSSIKDFRREKLAPHIFTHGAVCVLFSLLLLCLLTDLWKIKNWS